MPSGRAYYLVTPKARKGRPDIAAFRAWIVAEIAAMQRGARRVGGRRKAMAAASGSGV